MAPRAGGRRTATASPQAVRTFGQQGRKTGVVLPESGTVDEYGMQRLSDIFSSPRKSRGSSSARSNRTRDDESEPMDIASSPGPGPQTVLKGRHLSIPRSKSPVKTILKSPARRGLARDRMPSSDENATVTRRIDFGNARSAGPKRGQPSQTSRANGINGALQEESDDDVDPVEFGDHPPTDDIINHSLQIAEEMGEYSDEEPPIVGDEADSDAELFPTRPGSGKKGKQRRLFPEPEPVEAENPEDEERSDPGPETQLPPPRRPGRPPKKDPKTQRTADARGSKKRQSIQEVEEPAQAKRQKTTAASAKSPKGKATALAKSANKPGRPKGRPKKVRAPEDEDVGDTSMAALQRGPPMPKARGLVSVRHEEGMKQTRSGRHSFKPLAFWRGEATVAEREDYDDMFQKDRHFVLPSVKEVVRVAADVAPSKRAPRSKSRAKTKSKSTAAQEEDEELEEWETKPGTMTGEVVIWEPEHELHPPAEDEPVHIAEEQIAISGDAVQTRDIRDATFRFAKTLTMPFMGAGIVDLPPGAEKRPKNSRKMHMAFFVHYGKVMVTVNEAQFRISPGGTWFVPRGNYYSITNDYDNPARIFFAQACEVPAQPVDLGEE